MRKAILIVVGGLLLTLLIASTALAIGPGTGFNPDYFTSNLCQQCHGAIHGSWSQSAHGTGVASPISRGGNCRSCHVTNFDPDVSVTPGGDYTEEGAGCEACHGPLSLAHDAARRPDWRSNAEICGQCHSRHSNSTLEGFTNIEYAIGYQPDQDLEDFVTIPAPVGFPGQEEGYEAEENFWTEYPSWHKYNHGGGGQQYQEWRQSAHAAAGVECADCHTPHDAGIGSQDDPDVPGVEGHAMLRQLPPQLCANCHSSTTLPQANMLKGQGGVGATAPANVHSTFCIECHMPPTGYAHNGFAEGAGNHLWKIVMPEVAASLETTVTRSGVQVSVTMPESACSRCHGRTPDPLATYLQPVIDGRQNDVGTRLQQLDNRLDGLTGLTGSNLALWQDARANVDFVMADGSQGVHNYNYAVQLLDVAEDKLDAITGTPAPSFTDLKTGDLYFNEVMFLAGKGIVAGFGDGTYGTFRTITRAQFSKMVVLTAGLHTDPIDNQNDPSFSDVPYAGVPYPFDFVEEAAAAGIVLGFPGGTFQPNANITRAQMALMITRAGGDNLATPPVGYVTGFNDTGSLGAEAQAAIAKCKFNNIISGKNATTFAPFESANRGQAAKMLFNLYNLINPA
jgi:hypothetical protein